MPPFSSNLLHEELDSLESAIVGLRSEIAKRSDGASASAYDLSRQLYQSGLKVFIHCANHVDDTAPAGVSEELASVSGAPEGQLEQSWAYVTAPRHAGSRHRSVRMLSYLWHQHIDRWLGPGLAVIVMVAAIVGLVVLMFMAGLDAATTPDRLSP